MNRRQIVTTICALALSGAAAANPKLPPADVAAMVKKYGKPDVDYSSAAEKPRPPLVTRQLEYKAAGVRWVLLADGPVGAPPPYKGWLLMGAQDLKTLKRVSPEDADRRILDAQRKAK